MSISKVKGSTTIIRRPDYARKDTESVSEVEISNKDSKLDNNFFNDLIFQKQKQKKHKDDKSKKHQEPEQKKDSNKQGITDFYV